MGNNILIAYFSITKNTEEVAKSINRLIPSSSLYKIQTLLPYPTQYTELAKQVTKEIKEKEKPILKEKTNNLDYDVYFIGSPNWCGTIASPIRSFLTSTNMIGKKICLFGTHGGGGIPNFLKDVKGLCPRSEIIGIYESHNGSVDEEKLLSWIKSLNI